MKVFYHNDPDGKLSAWVVKYCLTQKDRSVFDTTNPKDLELISIDYDKTFPINTIEKDEIVFIVDYSLPMEDMEALCKRTSKVIWIDHHKTAIEKFKGTEYEYTRGIRSTKYAACVLAWMWFGSEDGDMIFLKEELDRDDTKEIFDRVPRFIKLVGDYDNWNWWYKEDTGKFYSGIFVHNMDPNSKRSIWDDLIVDTDNENVLAMVSEEGHTIKKYRRATAASFCSHNGYRTTFHGYKTFVANHSRTGSQFFDTIKDCDIFIAWVYKGDKYVVSTYSNDKEIDVSEIAKKYGGGGHYSASGFSCTELPEELMKKI